MAKKKIYDDRLLQLIRDGNSPAEAARRPGLGKLYSVFCLLLSSPVIAENRTINHPSNQVVSRSDPANGLYLQGNPEYSMNPDSHFPLLFYRSLFSLILGRRKDS